MKIDPELKVSLRHSLVPSLLFQLKIFQMPRLELKEFIEKELEQNIFLEEIHRGKEIIKEKEEEIDLEDIIPSIIEEEQFLYSRQKEMDERDEPGEFTPAPAPSLGERLEIQIPNVFKLKFERKIAYEIISALNEEGFLKVPPELLAEEIGVSIKDLERVRKKFMKLDPVGVGSRDFKEALLAQIEVLDIKDKLVYTLVRDHLEDLCNEERKAQLLEKFKISEYELDEAIRIIRALSPKPGLKYASKNVEYVVPDVAVIERGGKFVPVLIENDIPRIRINPSYLRILKNKELNKEGKQILKRHLKNAIELFSAIITRRKNILKIAEFIMEFHKPFFEKGDKNLKPIAQIDLSKILGISPSTLNRLLNSKYIETPRGIFSFRFFFPGGIKTEKGRISKEMIKNKISELIEKEGDACLTDKKIADILQGEGIKIKRRTVQKYREEMKIPPLSERKNK